MKPTPTNSTRTFPKLPLLISYAYLREEPATIERVMSDADVELLIDSGAFTAMNAGREIDLSEYISFIRRYQEKIFGYMALDKLRDPAQTDRNLRVMLDAGLQPIPVHVLGDDGRRMDELFEISHWVALGGLRRPHRGPAPLNYIKQKMDWARGRNVHWLGYTTKSVLEAFRPYSCDCSSWVSGAMYGRMAVYGGQGRWVNFTREEMLRRRLWDRPDLRAALDYYDIPLGDLLAERHWRNGNKAAGLTPRECMIVQLPARSWVRYVIDFRLRFGTRFFLACHGQQVNWLLDAYALVRRKYSISVANTAAA